jgi:dCTP diphosphatase
LPRPADQCVALQRFASDRDWDQFHSPKNLAIALSVEAAELLEHFQWMQEADSALLTPDQHAKVREEIADVLLYLIRLSDKARGSRKKYTEL